MSVYDKVIEAGEAIKRSQVSLEVFEAWSFEKQATWIACGAPVPVRVADSAKCASCKLRGNYERKCY